jgi:hypothetical protein
MSFELEKRRSALSSYYFSRRWSGEEASFETMGRSVVMVEA